VADTIFVTGGTGAIGRAVVAELLARGFKVAALVRSETQKVPGARSVVGELRGLHKVVHKVKTCAGAIHLASTRSDDVYRVFMDDVLGAAQLAGMFKDRPIVYASSQTVYGIPTSNMKETQPLRPVTWYDFGVCAAEHIMSVSHNYDTRGVRICCRLAPVLVHGARKTDRQFFTSIFEHCDRGGVFLVGSAEGEARFGTSYLGPDDAARGLVDCISLPESTVMNLSSGFATWSMLIAEYNALAGANGSVKIRKDVTPHSSKERRLPQSRSYLDRSRSRAISAFVPRQRLRPLIQDYLSDNT
jgi:nucleoside-diphosphate-sugar epimerase